MFDELKKYKENAHFFFNPTDSLKEICNAPSNKSGIYLVYSLERGQVELIYIGRSGKLDKDGSMFIRKAGLGGLKDRIVNGHQFGKVPRRRSWPIQMFKEDIEALDVYWYVTHSGSFNDCPDIIENKLLVKYSNIYGCLPRWNNQI
ncbi:MAG: hypothetical protein ABI203_02970 [Mucilaginibacter sp.]